MKTYITENDIQRMVFRGVKRAIFENVSIKDIIYDADLPLDRVSDALEAVYPEAMPEYTSNEGDFSNMINTVCRAYDSSSEEKKAEFRAKLGLEQGAPENVNDDDGLVITSWESEGGNDEEPLYSGDEPIDFELDPIVSEKIERTVNRVVTRKLNEIARRKRK